MRTLRIAALLVIAGTLLSCNKAQQPNPNAGMGQALQSIRVEAGANGFLPDEIEVPPNEPVVIEFVRGGEDGCTDAVVFPATGIRHDLKPGEGRRVSLQLSPGQSVEFTCPMDMYRGRVFAAAESSSEIGSAAEEPPGDFTALKIEVNASGFNPDRIEIVAGEPRRLQFTRTAEKTCNTAVVFPSLGINRDLPLNTPVEIEIPADRAGTFAFSCPMEMSKGTVEVVAK